MNATETAPQAPPSPADLYLAAAAFHASALFAAADGLRGAWHAYCNAIGVPSADEDYHGSRAIRVYARDHLPCPRCGARSVVVASRRVAEDDAGRAVVDARCIDCDAAGPGVRVPHAGRTAEILADGVLAYAALIQKAAPPAGGDDGDGEAPR